MIIENGIIYEKTYMNKLRVSGFVTGFETKNLIIPNEVNGLNVIEIASNAFANKGCIFFVEIPETIDLIGEHAFLNCYNLEQIQVRHVSNFKEKATLVIDKGAFKNCNNLKYFIGKNRTLTIQYKAFEDCFLLKKVDAKIQKLFPLAFCHCCTLKEIIFATSGILKNECLGATQIAQLYFMGDAIISKEVFKNIKNSNIKIKCIKNSNIEKYVYYGYHIEIVNTIDELFT